MKATIKKKYLDSIIEIEMEGKDEKELLFKAAIFTDKDQCFLCKNTEIGVSGNKTAEGHLYVKRKCTNPKCNATSSLGSYKDGSGHFWHKWEIYVPPAQNPAVQATNQRIAQNSGMDLSGPPPLEDLPF